MEVKKNILFLLFIICLLLFSSIVNAMGEAPKEVKIVSEEAYVTQASIVGNEDNGSVIESVVAKIGEDPISGKYLNENPKTYSFYLSFEQNIKVYCHNLSDKSVYRIYKTNRFQKKALWKKIFELELVGVDEKWQSSPEDKRFKNLAPGEYVVEVQILATDKDPFGRLFLALCKIAYAQ